MKLWICVIIASSGLLIGVAAQANLREMIKARLIEKQKEKPAPVAETAPKKLAPGDYTLKMTYADELRYYKVHVPAAAASGQALPLLIVLHGGGGDMAIQATEKYYKQISKSDSEGFVAVFPNGASAFKSGKLATWNAGKCCGLARDSKSDDVGFIKEIIKKTVEQLSIDSNRIFATGMSNGGMMAYRLACELPGTFRAIAAVAGTDNTNFCQPTKPVSILHIHAKDDDHVLFDGGAGKNAFRDRTQVNEFTSVADTIDQWRKLDSCEEKPRRILDKKGAYCDVYSCKAGSRVQLCVTESGGHSWPGGQKPSRFAGDRPSTVISANDIMWDFFNTLK
jgi:polyhydroxybutyrate depolymerase